MNRTYKYLLLVALVISSSSFARARWGGSCGGGGSVIKFAGQSQYFLLDRLTLSPELAKAPTSAEIPPVKEHSNSPEPEISHLKPEDHLAIEAADHLLDAWLKGLSPGPSASRALIELISGAIHRLTYLRTSHLFFEIPRYHLEPSLIQLKPDIQTAIAYVPRYGSIISAPIWEKLDRVTRAGLLIHEALRQIQNLYGFDDLSDMQLQAITAHLVDTSPSVSFQFDSLMSERLLRFCIVKAGGESSSNAPQADQAIANLASGLYLDLMLALDQTQKNRAEDLKLQVLLKDLLKLNILK